MILGESFSGRKRLKRKWVEKLDETSSLDKSFDSDGEMVNKIKELIM